MAKIEKQISHSNQTSWEVLTLDEEFKEFRFLKVAKDWVSKL